MTNLRAHSESSAIHTATFSLTAALIALPLLQSLPIDFDRTATLLVVPALWTGRRELILAVSELAFARPWIRFAMLVLMGAVLVAIAFSNHAAASATTAASWVLLIAAGILAGFIARHDTRSQRKLFGGLAVGAALGASIVWISWSTGGRGAIPLYAHHRIYGLHMLVGAMASTCLVLRCDNARRRAIWLVIGAITWGAVLWSGGRAPLLALAAGLGGWFVVRAGDRKRLVVACAIHLIAGLALSAAFWTTRAELGWWHAYTRTAAAATTGGGTVNVTTLTSTRNEFWRDAIGHAKASPWIGHGPDGYRFITPKLDGQQPHNFILQLWLDLGALGAVPALLLLAATTLFGWWHSRQPEHREHLVAWVALLTTLLLAGMLDGVFYHLLTLLPAMLALGIVGCLLVLPPNGDGERRGNADGIFVRLAIGAAILVVSFHSYLFHALAVAEFPSGPNAFAARALRVFPSTTFRLWDWLDHWHRTNPDVALEWARWAETRAMTPVTFHIRAAQYLQLRGEQKAALDELRLAEAKAHWTARPAIAEFRKKMSLSAP